MYLLTYLPSLQEQIDAALAAAAAVAAATSSSQNGGNDSGVDSPSKGHRRTPSYGVAVMTQTSIIENDC